MFPLKYRRNLLHFYIPTHLNKVETTYLGSAEDMKLYRCWVEDYEVNESRHSSSVSHIREAEGSYGMRAPHVLTSSKGMGMVVVAMGQIQNRNQSPKQRRKKVKTNCAELWTDQNMFL
jgi:hypothetical protein